MAHDPQRLCEVRVVANQHGEVIFPHVTVVDRVRGDVHVRTFLFCYEHLYVPGVVRETCRQRFLSRMREKCE